MGGDLEDEASSSGLADEVRDLPKGRTLRIAQFTADGLVLWDVRRDEAGTPHAYSWPALPWSDFLDLDVLSGPELNRAARAGDGGRMMLVCSSPDHSYAAGPMNCSPGIIAMRLPSATWARSMKCSIA